MGKGVGVGRVNDRRGGAVRLVGGRCRARHVSDDVWGVEERKGLWRRRVAVGK